MPEYDSDSHFCVAAGNAEDAEACDAKDAEACDASSYN